MVEAAPLSALVSRGVYGLGMEMGLWEQEDEDYLSGFFIIDRIKKKEET